MFTYGTTTAEAKTGYGLRTSTELRMLQALLALDREGPLELGRGPAGQPAARRLEPRGLGGGGHAWAAGHQLQLRTSLTQIQPHQGGRALRHVCEPGVGVTGEVTARSAPGSEGDPGEHHDRSEDAGRDEGALKAAGAARGGAKRLGHEGRR